MFFDRLYRNVGNYDSTKRKITEMRKSHLYSGGKLISLIVFLRLISFVCQVIKYVCM